VEAGRLHIGGGRDFANTMKQIVRETGAAETLLNHHAGYYLIVN